MKQLIVIGFALGWSCAAIAGEPPPVVPASEAIRLADAGSSNGVKGRYEIAVVSAKKIHDATVLDSSADYRAADNLTFRIAPIVAQMLTKRYGAPPEIYFVGKTVTVDGIVRRSPVYSTVNGQLRDFSRFAHTVNIDRAAQIVALR